MARHIPHLLIGGPWGDQLELDADQMRHLTRVLRLDEAAAVSYTDGEGALGSGTLRDDRIERGAETTVARPSAVRLAVAPIKSADRMRSTVEKLQELGVAELIWLDTRHGQASPPHARKVAAWVTGALEQSRGAWRMSVSGPTTISALDRPVLADQAGSDLAATATGDVTTLCVGPEGGWHAEELDLAPSVRLAAPILRTDTAAVVAAVAAITLGLADGG